MAKRYKGKQARKQPREAVREPPANANTFQQAVIGEAAENYPIYTSMWGRTGFWFGVILLAAMMIAAFYYAFSHPTSVGMPF